ncbi:universal stress protein UspA-like protein [Salinarchaeum sp. Harcht-Bsk1]|uniref:universal stress protein n=1 Tax=Salinarchaeum sp. Harcht-Bsk1 TaxID=1333523 RepID=UPI0003423FE7|nr:universal stress protein [Salinarchaeum sp. Harcht-Bsk1]AGN02731.1 universal stress protein UspA-like protein [Salinarchaeum sp. Harcht-Bsk1]
MYDTIVVPTDGSEGPCRAVEQAYRLAAAFDATVHALYVVDETFPAHSHYDVVRENMEDTGESAVERIESNAPEGVTVEKVFLTGVPHEEIIAYAEDHDADLIAMGTNGRTGLSRFVAAGSTTERVVRASPVPVLTARRDDPTADE